MTDQTQQAAPAAAPQPAAPAGLQAAGQPGTLPPGVKLLDIGAVLNGFHTRIAALETAAKQDVSKGKAFVMKYWPIAAGLAIAATRFLK
jgi:hypothetical protein